MATLSNSAPDTKLAGLVWPAERAGEALFAAAREAGLPLTRAEVLTMPAGLSPEEASHWIEAAAVRGGLEAAPSGVSLHDARALASRGAPLLFRIGSGDVLAIVRGGRRTCIVITPLLQTARLRLHDLDTALRKPFIERMAPALDPLVTQLPGSERARARARAALMAERLRDARLRGCWLLRLPAGSNVRDEIRETRLIPRAILLVAAHAAQYALFLASWWLLGRGVLRGVIDSGWLLGWVLLLFSLIPFRLYATWTQGLFAMTAGAALRRRLLRGALQIDRDDVRRAGAGQLFGHVMEIAAVESLALSGGVAALFSVFELIIAGLVLLAGASKVTAVVLALWTFGTLWLALRYFQTRRSWTQRRLSITNSLLESMLGHRTRLAQQPISQWHPEEDVALAQYLDVSRRMDSSAVWLQAFIPRGWLAVSLGTMIPAVIQQATPLQLAVSIGGILLAMRSLRRLVTGLAQATGAAVAGEAIAPLIRAASRRSRTSPPHPTAVVSKTSADSVAIQAREIHFRYPGQVEPVLQDCSLIVQRGQRFLLEGPSGAGKTTLASILAGLETAASGLVLVDGLDRSVLGKAGWRKRVVLAPQAHDNYLIGASLAFNLLMGRQWPPQRSDLQDAEAVCRELGLGELLDRLPGGLHQIVGETGWQLSQGERTRVFLARALLQQPEVLVLDESFSALDPENVDRAIRCVLRRAPTVVAIAHP
jgi:ATP-binding cassette subfamily B protein